MISFLDSLSNFCIYYLNITDICSLLSVSKYLFETIEYSNNIWLNLCKRDFVQCYALNIFIEEYKSDEYLLYKKYYIDNFRYHYRIIDKYHRYPKIHRISLKDLDISEKTILKLEYNPSYYFYSKDLDTKIITYLTNKVEKGDVIDIEEIIELFLYDGQYLIQFTNIPDYLFVGDHILATTYIVVSKDITSILKINIDKYKNEIIQNITFYDSYIKSYFYGNLAKIYVILISSDSKISHDNIIDIFYKDENPDFYNYYDTIIDYTFDNTLDIPSTIFYLI